MAKVDMLINVILDRSGSMSGQERGVIEHFNAYKEELAYLIQKINMSVYQFDTQYEAIVENIPVQEVPNLTKKVYFARGGTALLDAIGRTIRQVDALEDKPSKIVIVINTDGFENSSHEFTHAQIKEMVSERQNNHDWQFVFVGAGIDAFATGTSFGIRGNNTLTTTNDWTGYNDSYFTLTNSTVSYASGRSNTMDMVTNVTKKEDEEEEKVKSE